MWPDYSVLQDFCHVLYEKRLIFLPLTLPVLVFVWKVIKRQRRSGHRPQEVRTAPGSTSGLGGENHQQRGGERECVRGESEERECVRGESEKRECVRGQSEKRECVERECVERESVGGEREVWVEVTDELYNEYDSTWETEEQNQETNLRHRRTRTYNYRFQRFKYAAKDMRDFRHDYPMRSQQRTHFLNSQSNLNLKFYTGEVASVPDGVTIQEFHSQWFGCYDRLEYVHTYIQWLFPLQEQGMNPAAPVLTKDEIEEFRHNSYAMSNLLKSYKLMLDFYGIYLCDERTGAVTRAENWRERFHNLNSNTHNNLRITRILKCLGTLGFAHLQAPLVQFFLEETLVNGELQNVKESTLNFFIFAVLDKTQRRHLVRFAYSSYKPKDEFVWCPKKIQTIWSDRSPLDMSTEDTSDEMEVDD